MVAGENPEPRTQNPEPRRRPSSFRKPLEQLDSVSGGIVHHCIRIHLRPTLPDVASTCNTEIQTNYRQMFKKILKKENPQKMIYLLFNIIK